MEHHIDTELLQKRVQVHLVGVGGNGAQMAACLARLDIAMKELGHPFGLHVKAFDADRVSEANVGRQLYSRSDIGRLKAVITVHRLNQFYGLDWESHPCRYEDFECNTYRTDADIVISCVDTRNARRHLHQRLFQPYGRCHYWLDLGNREAQAQAILGQPPGTYRRRQENDALRLPCVTELFPDLLDENAPDDNMPSCSVRMSLASQGLFVNDVIVRFAAHMLYELFSKGRIAQHGVMVNLDSKRSGPIEVDASAWQRFGYKEENREDPERDGQRQVA